MAEQQRRVEIYAPDEEAAAEIKAALAEQGATEIEESRVEGVIPVLLPFVVAALIGAAGITSIVIYIGIRRGCLVVVDARGDDVKVKQHCEIRDGRVILVAGDDTKIELKDVPPLLDFTKIATTVVEQGAEAAKSAAEAAGATAKVLAPDTPLPAD